MVKLYDLNNLKFLSSIKGHHNVITTAAFTEDTRLIISGGRGKAIHLADVNKSTTLYTIDSHTH